SLCDTKTNILPILFRERRSTHRGARQIHSLMRHDPPSSLDPALDRTATHCRNEELDQSVIDQDSGSGTYVLRQLRIGHWNLRKIHGGHGPAANLAARSEQASRESNFLFCHHLDTCSFERAYADSRPLQVQHNRNRVTQAFRNGTDCGDRRTMRVMCAMREVKAGHNLPLVDTYVLKRKRC